MLPKSNIHDMILYESKIFVKNNMQEGYTMITNGFTYVAVLIFIAAMLLWLQKFTKWKFFDFVPPIVLLYLVTMIFCTVKVWDLGETKAAYSGLKNNILYLVRIVFSFSGEILTISASILAIM